MFHLIRDWVSGGELRRAMGYEHQDEGVPAVTAEHFNLKYVGIVATIIGSMVLSLGLIGLTLYLI